VPDSPKKIVIIDDDKNTLAVLEAILRRRGFSPHVAPTAAQGKKRVADTKPDLVLLDIGLPDESGLDVLSALKSEEPELPVIILTGDDTLENAIDAIKRGAFHFVSKPYQPEELLSLVGKALEQSALTREALQLRDRNVALERQLEDARRLLEPIFVSRRMKEVESLIERVAPTTANVFLAGESGVGKEVLAARIHRLSPRAVGPLVKLNCGAFPANMIEAELFGYVKGAFTGAVTAFPGMLAESEGGTLFLDEVTEMPPDLQTRFLRVLQEREFRPLGSTKTRSANFRLVAATNRDPGEAVREGRLRQDLYFRLKTFQVEIPPLRERSEDIPRLADIFLRRFALQNHREPPLLAPQALQMLVAYSWPGNVRELQNAIEHATILAEVGVIEPKHLPAELHAPIEESRVGALRAAMPPPNRTLLKEAEKRAIVEALQKTRGNKKQAAALLGIHRPTLYAKMKRHGLSTGGTEELAGS
jgi:DNA-binding NtrC family response regulator